MRPKMFSKKNIVAMFMMVVYSFLSTFVVYFHEHENIHAMESRQEKAGENIEQAYEQESCFVCHLIQFSFGEEAKDFVFSIFENPLYTPEYAFGEYWVSTKDFFSKKLRAPPFFV